MRRTKIQLDLKAHWPLFNHNTVNERDDDAYGVSFEQHDGQAVVQVNGHPIARRGEPSGPHAGTWVSILPGWEVTDVNYPTEIRITFDGRRHP